MRMIVGISALVLAAGSFSGGLATGLGMDSDDGASRGSTVSFHLDAFSRDDALIFSTRSAETLDGLPLLPQMSHGGPQQGVIAPLRNEEDSRGSTMLNVGPYVLGHEAGFVVWTPYFYNPLGEKQEYELPRRIGPLTPLVHVNVTEEVRDWPQFYPPPSQWVPGKTVRYGGVLPATITEVDGTTATLQVDAAGGETLRLDSLNINATVVVDAGQVYLEPMLSVGQEFSTQGCSLPGAILSPGTYRVGDITASVFELDPPQDASVLYDSPVRFRIELVSVD